jgi:formylglycine-generating enzyme required for sulfatase activity
MTETVKNSLGMAMVSVPAGMFAMGSESGDWDERPVHLVSITRPLRMAVTPVTNAQYEQFDPDHRAYRGLRSLSAGDDEAVTHVSWHDAERFCRWLSDREGKPYRLPTEAEWEYACRAGSKTAYWPGDTLPEVFQRSQQFSWDPQPVDLTVGTTPPNPWGLCDMHGLVEEWCSDWYAPYPSDSDGTPCADPVGGAEGEFRVTRGGSHNTGVAFLRSANRSATLPDDKQWLIGFRVVQAEPVAGDGCAPGAPPLWATGVAQKPLRWTVWADPQEPYFAGPVPFVHIPAGSNGPLFSKHNHCPTITWCPNGDLLAAWFSTNTERGREMTIAASRLRYGRGEWEPADLFLKAADRNMTGSALFNDGNGTLYHFNGLEAGDGWANLALVMRTSADNGATWSGLRLINPNHQPRNQVISGTFMTRDGAIVQACDAVYGGNGGTAIHISRDDGRTWVDPGAGTPKPDFKTAESGGTIAGIHAGVVELVDGRLMAYGRGDSRLGGDMNIDDRMPCSISPDMGQTWHYSPSPWPPISSGQRLVLMRLREGPLLFVSFTDRSDCNGEPAGLRFLGSDGHLFTGYGLFAALSFDEGKTWPARKLLVPPAGGTYDGGAWTRSFQADSTHAEPRGYMAATQSPDRIIHLISSALHYRFNLAWLLEPNDPPA